MAAPLRIVLNGEPRELEGPLTVLALLEALAVPVEGAAVEINRSLVPRAALPSRLLEDGDRVEVVTFVGGG